MTTVTENEEPKYAYDGYKAVDFAINGQPVEFKDMINLGLASRIQNSIETKREAIAAGLFGQPSQPSEPEEEPEAPQSEEPAEEAPVEQQEEEEAPKEE